MAMHVEITINAQFIPPPHIPPLNIQIWYRKVGWLGYLPRYGIGMGLTLNEMHIRLL
jgi:hypothetical protein